MIQIESHYPDSSQLVTEQRLRRNTLFGLMVAVVLAVFGVIGYLVGYGPTTITSLTIATIGLTIFVCLALPILIWNEPRRGFYILLAGAITCNPVAADPTPTIPTTFIPFWWNISSIGQKYLGTGALDAFVFSPAEVLMAMTFGFWLLRSIMARSVHLERGAFFWPIVLYSVAVFLGFLHGISTGGNSTMALYEVRAQAYFLFCYLIAVNVLTRTTHIKSILWNIVLTAGIMGVCGTITYFAWGGEVDEQGIMGHEKSLFLNLLFFMLVMASIRRLDRRLVWACWLLMPSALNSALANQRRSGIAAFIIAFLPLIPILWFIMREQRQRLARFIVVSIVCSAIYFPIAWNGKGIWALPARAIRSQSDPNERDASSDYYRLAESLNLKYTRDQEPWTGIGYGKRFAEVYNLGDLTTDFIKYMPHNSVLWVWMRIGHIGFFLFLMMLATILIRGVQVLKETKRPILQTGGLLGLLMVLMVYTFGKYDLALASGPVMMLTGGLVGILAVTDKIDATEDAAELKEAETVAA